MYPLVSVIIPTYKRPDRICRAVASVLSQTYQKVEVLVVDDNGTDTEWREKTHASLYDYIARGRIRYLTSRVNRGVCAARNMGFENAKGDYIAFLDDDDQWTCNFLEEMVRALQAAAGGTGLIYSGRYLVSEHKRFEIRPGQTSHYVCELLSGKNRIGSPSFWLLKREVVQAVGGFDPGMPAWEDLEFLIRVARGYGIGYVDQLLATYHECSGDRRTNQYEIIVKAIDDLLEKYQEEYRKNLYAKSMLLFRKAVLQIYFGMPLSTLKNTLRSSVNTLKTMKNSLLLFLVNIPLLNQLTVNLVVQYGKHIKRY